MANKDKKVTIKLNTPVEYGNEVIAELTFRRPKGKDFRKLPMDMNSQKVGVMMDLAADLAGVSMNVIDELDGADVTEVMELVASFIGKSPETGSAA